MDSPSNETPAIADMSVINKPQGLADPCDVPGLDPELAAELQKEGYSVIRKLGVGGSGTVFQAREHALGREVAIKVLNPDRKNSARAARAANQFEQEMQMGAKIEHDRVVRVYNQGCLGNGQRYMVMQFVKGGSLRGLIRPNGVDPKKAAQIMRDVADALHFVHTRPKEALIHRDLKPENILLDESEKPYIADFGLAAFAGELHQHAASIGGTIPYMSPEQVRAFQGRGHSDVGIRSDVWALGVILYELLTGEPPFKGDSRDELMEAIERYEPHAPKELNTGIPARLDEITRECLRKESNDRFQSAGEMATSLREWTDSQALQPCFQFPFWKNTFFTGRDCELKRLRELLAQYGIAAITGIGGAGKTQVAAEYAYRHQVDYSHIFWLRADSAETLEGDLCIMARELTLPEAAQPNRANTIDAARKWLSVHLAWLLVLEGAEDPQLAARYLPSNRGGHVLITARNPVIAGLGVKDPIRLECFPAADSLKFLLRRANREGAPPSEHTAAAALTNELGHLPLALEQAAAYIDYGQASFSDYLASYSVRRLKLLEQKAPEVGDYRGTVATTWSLNFEQVKQASPPSADLLRISAFLHFDRIPLELIRLGGPSLGETLKTYLAAAEQDPLALDELLAPLLRYSLISRDPIDDSYTLHVLVQEVTRASLALETQCAWIVRVIEAILATFPESPQFAHWPRWDRLLPHAKQILQHAQMREVATANLAAVAYRAARFLQERFDYIEAAQLYRRCLDVAERVHGKDSWQVAAALSKLAIIGASIVQNSNAVPLAQEALDATKKLAGTDGRDVAASLLTLAIACEHDKEFDRADQLYDEALALARTTYAADDANLAIFMQHVAHARIKRGRHERAREILRDALRLAERSHGSAHGLIPCLLDDLAKASEPAEREGLYRRALAMDETAGTIPWQRAQTLLNLSKTILGQSRREERHALVRQALSVLENAFGPDHQEVADCLIELGRILAENDADYERSAVHLNRARLILERKHADCYSQAAHCHDRLAYVLLKMGQPEKALPLIDSSVAMREVMEDFGSREHGWLAIHTILDFFEATNDEAATCRFLDRALAVIKKKPGGDPYLRAWCLQCRGSVACLQGKSAQAITYWMQAMDVWAIIPDLDPNLGINFYNLLANAYLEQGKCRDAAAWAEAGLRSFQDALPAGHSEVAALKGVFREAQESCVDRGRSENAGERPYWSPATRHDRIETAGRNEPCPCGSGRKYKHCCLKRIR